MILVALCVAFNWVHLQKNVSSLRISLLNMRWHRPLQTLFLLSAPAIFADTVEAGRDIEDNDIKALKEWIDTKRQISLKEIGGDLSLSGEVRTEFQSSWERRNGKDIRGSNPLQLPPRALDIEFNFMLDFRTDQTWASLKLEFDDDMGIFSGTINGISLERAYWGVRTIQCDTYTFDIEIGRRSMSSVFDSKVMFGSFFDGVLFRYDRAFEKVGDYYFRLGAFIINDKLDHFGYVGEIGLLNTLGTGFYGKFSTVAWDTKSYPQSFINNRFNFIISQLTAGYRFRIESVKKIGIFYSAFLYNWEAQRLDISDFKRAPWGFYTGMSIGQLLRQWDWAFDLNYQIVLAQAFPDFDCSGSSLGNGDRSGFYTKFIHPLAGGGASTPETAAGTTNYHGYIFRFDLLLTDKLDVQQLFLQSWTWDKDIGPRRSYTQYEIEFIYSW